MAYSEFNPPSRVAGRIGGGGSVWIYRSADPLAVVGGVDYISNAVDLGILAADLVICVDMLNGIAELRQMDNSGTLVEIRTGVNITTFDGVEVTDVASGTNVTFTDDGDGSITLNVSSGTATLGDGDYGDISVSGDGTVFSIDNDAVTNAKLANMAQATVKGRAVGAGTGDPVDLTASQLRRVISTDLTFEDFGAVGDGVADDTAAVVAALAAGVPVRKTGIYLIDIAAGLEIPEGAEIKGPGVFRFEGTPGGVYLTILSRAKIEHLSVSTPGNEGLEIGVLVSGDDVEIGYAEYAGDAQNGTGTWLRIEGSRCKVKGFWCETHDRPLTIDNSEDVSAWAPSTAYSAGDHRTANQSFWECVTPHTSDLTFDDENWELIAPAEDNTVESIHIRNYVRGIRAQNQIRATITKYDMRLASVNATGGPGENGILTSNLRDSEIGPGIIEDAPEHAYRVGGAGCIGLTFRSPTARNSGSAGGSGGCGIKLNPGAVGSYCQRVKIIAPSGEDIGAGIAGGNREFFRFSHCRGVDVIGASVVPVNEATSCQKALLVNDVQGLRIRGFHARDCNGAAIQVDEESDVSSQNPAGASRDIHIRDMTGGGARLLSIASPNFDYGDIFIRGLEWDDFDAETLTNFSTGSGAHLDGRLEIHGNIVRDTAPAFDVGDGDIPATDDFYVDLTWDNRRSTGRPGDLNFRRGRFSISTGAADLSDTTETAGFYVSALEATAGLNNYGGGYFVGAPGLSRRAGGMIAKQTDADFGRSGLAFVTRQTNITTTDLLTEHLVLQHNGFLLPSDDNGQQLGGAANRWEEIFAGNGTINTSDEREKTDIGPIPDEWLDAWGDVEWCVYRWSSAVEAKGDGARWHVGLIAQRVRDAFAARGLDAFAIGLLCWDAWDEIQERREVAGGQEIVHPGRPAGDRYGLRYVEALAMEAAWTRRELGRR